MKDISLLVKVNIISYFSRMNALHKYEIYQLICKIKANLPSLSITYIFTLVHHAGCLDAAL